MTKETPEQFRARVDHAEMLRRESRMPDHPGAVLCLCGGKLTAKYYEAYSCDSSFDYAGCSRCELSIMHDEINHETVEMWNRHNRVDLSRQPGEGEADYLARLLTLAGSK